jgi:hypothetical protein
MLQGVAGVVLLVLNWAVFAATVYAAAAVHAAMQRPDAYTAADKLTKPVWLLILIGSALLLLLLRGTFGMAIAAVAAALVAAGTVGFPAPAAAQSDFIDHIRWVSYDGLPTLRVYLTAAGREVAGDLGRSAAQSETAWAQLLALAPDADTPGMRGQFLCHWTFAEIAQPGKPTWDLEPWRPPVDDGAMIVAGCNPGGAERG